MPAKSAELWSAVSTKGVKSVDLFIKPSSDSVLPGVLVTSIETDIDAPAPQIRFAYEFDSRKWANGTYDILVQAINSAGIESHPVFDGFAFKWDAAEISGADYPVEVAINNPTPAEFIFQGSIDSLWNNDLNWETVLRPPQWYDGIIMINANCEMPNGDMVILGADAQLIIPENITLKLLED